MKPTEQIESKVLTTSDTNSHNDMGSSTTSQLRVLMYSYKWAEAPEKASVELTALRSLPRVAETKTSQIPHDRKQEARSEKIKTSTFRCDFKTVGFKEEAKVQTELMGETVFNITYFHRSSKQPSADSSNRWANYTWYNQCNTDLGASSATQIQCDRSSLGVAGVEANIATV